MKIISFIMTTVKYGERIQRVRNTWGKNIRTVFYSDHTDEQNSVIKVSDSSDYFDTDEKQVNVINTIRESYSTILDSYDWILFCDDDTFVNVNRLYEEVDYFNHNCIYGNLVNYQNHSTNPIFDKPGIPRDLDYPSGGSGFCISTQLLKTSGKFIDYKPRFGDVNVGLNAYHKKIPIVNCVYFYSNTPEKYNHDEPLIKKAITYHYIVDDVKMQYLCDLTKV
jgi:hypothetical protein